MPSVPAVTIPLHMKWLHSLTKPRFFFQPTDWPSVAVFIIPTGNTIPAGMPYVFKGPQEHENRRIIHFGIALSFLVELPNSQNPLPEPRRKNAISCRNFSTRHHVFPSRSDPTISGPASAFVGFGDDSTSDDSTTTQAFSMCSSEQRVCLRVQGL